MTRAVIGKGIFQFDTGSVMVLYDILRAMRDKRKPLGIRAGIELCIHIGNALQELRRMAQCRAFIAMASPLGALL